jgi:plasmid replication initiation protein
MLKPKELLELKGTGALTLQDRRVFNTLVHHSWGPNLAKSGHWFEIPTADLRADTDRNKRLQDTIERLMQTIVVVVEEDSDGNPIWEHRTPLLSSNSLVVGPNAGLFRYKFTDELVTLLKDSTIFAKLDLEVMRSFRSKYAFSLYEAIARRIRMKRFTETFSVDELRDILGVEDNKLDAYKNLNKYAIQPAVTEVNAITPYTVSIVPQKQGRKVVSFIMGWETKTEEQLQAAYAEMNRHSVGRKARADDGVDIIDTITASST